MRKLLRALKWIVDHVYVRTVDLNNGEGKPHTTIETGVKGTFRHEDRDT